MSSNLPPGVRESDIPGNRPEDIIYEAFWEKLFNTFPHVKWLETDEAQEVIDWVVGESYKQGYTDGTYEATMFNGLLESPEI